MIMLLIAGATFEGSLCNSGEGRLNNSCDVTKVDNPSIEQSERCCRKHGICSHEILQDEATNTNYKFAGRKVTRKVQQGHIYCLFLKSSPYIVC